MLFLRICCLEHTEAGKTAEGFFLETGAGTKRRVPKKKKSLKDRLGEISQEWVQILKMR